MVFLGLLIKLYQSIEGNKDEEETTLARCDRVNEQLNGVDVEICRRLWNSSSINRRDCYRMG